MIIMWLALLLLFIVILVFALAFIKGVALQKTIEEARNDDLEQAQYLRKWVKEHGEDKESDNIQ